MVFHMIIKTMIPTKAFGIVDVIYIIFHILKCGTYLQRYFSCFSKL